MTVMRVSWALAGLRAPRAFAGSSTCSIATAARASAPQDEAAGTTVPVLVVTIQEASTVAPTEIAERAVSADIAGDAARAARTGKSAARAAVTRLRSPVVKEKSAPLTKTTLLLLG